MSTYEHYTNHLLCVFVCFEAIWPVNLQRVEWCDVVCVGGGICGGVVVSVFGAVCAVVAVL